MESGRRLLLTMAVLLTMPIVATGDRQIITCSPAWTQQGQPASLTCHFGKNLRKTYTNFRINFCLIEGKINEPKCQQAISCNWLPSETLHCVTTDRFRGMTCRESNSVVGDFICELAIVSARHSGYYECRLIPSDTRASHVCHLPVPELPATLTRVTTEGTLPTAAVPSLSSSDNSGSDATADNGWRVTDTVLIVLLVIVVVIAIVVIVIAIVIFIKRKRPRGGSETSKPSQPRTPGGSQDQKLPQNPPSNNSGDLNEESVPLVTPDTPSKGDTSAGNVDTETESTIRPAKTQEGYDESTLQEEESNARYFQKQQMEKTSSSASSSSVQVSQDKPESPHKANAVIENIDSSEQEKRLEQLKAKTRLTENPQVGIFFPLFSADAMSNLHTGTGQKEAKYSSLPIDKENRRRSSHAEEDSSDASPSTPLRKAGAEHSPLLKNDKITPGSGDSGVCLSNTDPSALRKEDQ